MGLAALESTISNWKYYFAKSGSGLSDIILHWCVVPIGFRSSHRAEKFPPGRKVPIGRNPKSSSRESRRDFVFPPGLESSHRASKVPTGVGEKVPTGPVQSSRRDSKVSTEKKSSHRDLRWEKKFPSGFPSAFVRISPFGFLHKKSSFLPRYLQKNFRLAD